MIRGGFPSRSAGLVGLGLGHHGRHAFLIRQGRRRFSFRKQAVPERLPLIQQGHTPVEGLAYGDGRLVQDRPVDLVRVPGRHRETPVVVLDEGRQEGVGGVEVTDVPEPEFLDQPILQGLVGSFHPSLRLWAVGVDRLDIQSLQGAGERGQFALALRVIDPEDAVPVGVQGHRASMLAQILRQGLHVGAGGLGRNQTQRQQAAGGIVDEDGQSTRFSTDGSGPSGAAWVARVRRRPSIGAGSRHRGGAGQPDALTEPWRCPASSPDGRIPAPADPPRDSGAPDA